ncbi:MAG: MBOAT family protein [Bacteroidota bacterium]
MLFTSPVFLFLFLPLVILLSLPRSLRWQNGFLLFASIFFYAWGGVSYSAILAGSILLNYGFGRWIGAKKSTKTRKSILGLGVGINLALLVVFKYANFFVDNLNQIRPPADAIPWQGIILPLGISFFTFQAISYLVDVYRVQVQAQKNLVKLGLYIALFPQLIAGPIVRYKDLAAQLQNRSRSLDSFVRGIERFSLGLAKKLILANSIGIIADNAFAGPAEELNMLLAWWALLAYSLQIYFDFSAYSDMAIGLGLMFGFEIPENFDFPYMARSLREFWRRWHISLSTWFRDYLYIPLGGNRVSKARLYGNLLLVFFLTGFWHGASWNFIVWGLLHGAFLLLERRFGPYQWPAVLQRIYTLLAVGLAWVFFRCENLSESLTYLQVLVGVKGQDIPMQELSSFFSLQHLFFVLLGILASTTLFEKAWRSVKRAYSWTPYLNSLGLSLLLLLSAIYVSGSLYNPFIYFRF